MVKQHFQVLEQRLRKHQRRFDFCIHSPLLTLLRGLLCAGSHQMGSCCETARIRVPDPLPSIWSFSAFCFHLQPPRWYITVSLGLRMQQGRKRRNGPFSGICPRRYQKEFHFYRSSRELDYIVFNLYSHITKRDGGGSSLPGKSQRMQVLQSCSILRRHSQCSACLSSKRN